MPPEYGVGNPKKYLEYIEDIARRWKKLAVSVIESYKGSVEAHKNVTESYEKAVAERLREKE